MVVVGGNCAIILSNKSCRGDTPQFVAQNYRAIIGADIPLIENITAKIGANGHDFLGLVRGNHPGFETMLENRRTDIDQTCAIIAIPLAQESAAAGEQFSIFAIKN